MESGQASRCKEPNRGGFVLRCIPNPLDRFITIIIDANNVVWATMQCIYRHTTPEIGYIPVHAYSKVKYGLVKYLYRSIVYNISLRRIIKSYDLLCCLATLCHRDLGTLSWYAHRGGRSSGLGFLFTLPPNLGWYEAQ